MLKDILNKGKILNLYYIGEPVIISRDLEFWQIKQNYIPTFLFENKEYNVININDNYLFQFEKTIEINNIIPAISLEMKDNGIYEFIFKDIEGDIKLSFIEKSFWREMRINQILENE